MQCSVSLPLKIIARDSVASPTTRPTRNSHEIVAWVQKTVEVEAVVERYAWARGIGSGRQFQRNSHLLVLHGATQNQPSEADD